jgi:hypothetical protein
MIKGSLLSSIETISPVECDVCAVIIFIIFIIPNRLRPNQMGIIIFISEYAHANIYLLFCYITFSDASAGV